MGYHKNLLVATLLLAASPSLAISAEMPGGPGAPPPPCFHGPAKHPLTDAQRKTMSEVSAKFELDTAQTAAELHVSGRKLREMLHETTIDKAAATALQDRINSLRSTLANARLNMMIAMHDVLSEEQRGDMRFFMPPPPPPPPFIPFGPPMMMHHDFPDGP